MLFGLKDWVYNLRSGKLIEKSPRLEEWQNLYEAMIKIKEIAPWEWMTENDIFAVQNPENDQLGFVSVMGAAGEHYAISVYLGNKGLYGFWDLQQSAPDIAPNMFVEIPQLQAFFEDRDYLQPKDRDLIKQLGLKFRGRQSWPMFRSYRPGFFPWYLESDEARFLWYVLEQTMDVSMRFKDDRSLLQFADQEQLLVRVPIKKREKLLWQDSPKVIPPPEPSPIEITLNMFAVKALQGSIPSQSALEIDVFMSMTPLQEKGIRPFYPYILMMVDADSGLVVGNEILQPVPTLESMWESVPTKVVEWLAKIHLLPMKILVSSEFLYQLLLHLSDELSLSLELSETLPNLDQARAYLLEYLS